MIKHYKYSKEELDCVVEEWNSDVLTLLCSWWYGAAVPSKVKVMAIVIC